MLLAAMTAPLFSSPYVVATRPALYALGLIGAAGGALVAEIFRHWRFDAGLAAMVLVTAVALGAGSYVRLEAEPLRSYAALARTVQARAPDATLICYPRYVQALPFYTRRRVILVGAPTELRLRPKARGRRQPLFLPLERQRAEAVEPARAGGPGDRRTRAQKAARAAGRIHRDRIRMAQARDPQSQGATLCKLNPRSAYPPRSRPHRRPRRKGHAFFGFALRAGAGLIIVTLLLWHYDVRPVLHQLARERIAFFSPRWDCTWPGK